MSALLAPLAQAEDEEAEGTTVTPDGTPMPADGDVGDTEAEECDFLDVGCEAAQAASSAMDELARDATEAATEMAVSAGTAWIDHDTALVADPDTGAVSATVDFMLNALHPYTWLLSALSVMIAATMLMLNRPRDGAGDDPGFGAAKTLIRLVIISASGAYGIALVSSICDLFASWLLGQSSAGFAERFTEVLGFSELDTQFETSFAIAIIGALAWCVSAIQIGLLYIRDVVLILLAGVWPTAAAITNTRYGDAVYQHTTRWILGWMLYQPVGAIIYANAFLEGGNTEAADPGLAAIHALALFFLAIFALGATIKVVNPITSAVAGGSGGGGGGGIAALAQVGATGIAPSSGGGSPGAGAAGGAGGGAAGIAMAGVTAASQTAQAGVGSSGTGGGGGGGAYGAYGGSGIPPAGGGSSPSAQPPSWSGGGPAPGTAGPRRTPPPPPPVPPRSNP